MKHGIKNCVLTINDVFKKYGNSFRPVRTYHHLRSDATHYEGRTIEDLPTCRDQTSLISIKTGTHVTISNQFRLLAINIAVIVVDRIVVFET